MAHLSVVIPVYQAAECLPELYRRLCESLRSVTADFEIVLVEDGGTDGSWKIIDIYLSGTISEMARMRSDFSATVTGGGADGLIKALEDKIVEIKNHPN